MQLTHRIYLGFEGHRHLGIPSISWDERASSGGIELEPVEGALDAIADQFAGAESHTTMRALINCTGNFSLAIAPEDHFLTQASDTDRLSTPDFLGFKDNIPLVRDHIVSPLNVKFGQL
jgi:hypothetical protein